MRPRRRPAAALAILAALLIRPAFAETWTSYPTPDAAVTALVDAVRTGAESKLDGVLGPAAQLLVPSGDKVQDASERHRFIALYDTAHKLVTRPDGSMVLDVGPDDWPLPFPLRKGSDGTWRFDAAAGAQEIVDRRIGRNEIDAIQTLLALVDAQQDYAERAEKSGARRYAERIVSTGPSPRDGGAQDGLYWRTEGGEPPSPLGPLVDAAIAEGYPDHLENGRNVPYRGYLFHVLKAQGPHAPGGALDYFRHGQMTEGFGFAACPAAYGAGGYTSFIVNQDGVVFQKDLGDHTEAACGALATFDPDLSWARVEISPE